MSDDVRINGLKRLVFQFKKSTKLRGFIEAFLKEYNDIYLTNQDLLNKRWIDTAEGAQLDGIGEIVGFERPSVQAGLIGAFGFSGDSEADGFASLIYPESGGNLTSLTVAQIPMVDAQYRIALKAQLLFNASNMTVNETLDAVSYLMQAPVRYFLVDNLNPIYVIGKALSTYEIYQLGQLPLLLGIGNATFLSYDGDLSEYQGYITPWNDGYETPWGDNYENEWGS